MCSDAPLDAAGCFSEWSEEQRDCCHLEMITVQDEGQGQDQVHDQDQVQGQRGRRLAGR